MLAIPHRVTEPQSTDIVQELGERRVSSGWFCKIPMTLPGIVSYPYNLFPFPEAALT